jgi:hypothetical protein
MAGMCLGGQRVHAGDEAAVVRRAWAGGAEHADEQGGDGCGGAGREAAGAGGQRSVFKST